MINALPPLPLPPAPKRTVVVIDPSLSLRHVMAVTLRAHGYPVVSYAQPLTALTALRQGQVPWPTLVLLGEGWCRSAFNRPATAPSLDAPRILRLLQRWDVPLQVIVLLEEACVLAAIECRLAGACATLAKPFQIQHLLHLVQVYGRA